MKTDGTPYIMSPQSGHDKPSLQQFQNALRFLADKGIALSDFVVEWSIGNESFFNYFNAKVFAKPGVKGTWLEWPSMIGKGKLRRVTMNDPDTYIDPSGPGWWSDVAPVLV